MMKSCRKAWVALIAAALSLGCGIAARAALPVGAAAPYFTLQGGLGGKPMTFSLRQALSQGPVVLYFFPAAFTPGCTKEAHDFALAIAEFHELGASVVGVTAGNVNRVIEFSKVECRSRFPVVADPGAKIAAEYRTLLHFPGQTLSNRTSYVVAPDDRILLSYTDLSPDAHIQKALAAVAAYRKRQ